jgi:uncharacterized protein YciI
MQEISFSPEFLAISLHNRILAILNQEPGDGAGPLSEEHRLWLDDQHRAGRLLFSGPTTDGGFGIYIMLASSLSEAEEIAAQDPHHLRGIRKMQVLEWRAHRAFRLNGPTIEDLEQIAKKH